MYLVFYVQGCSPKIKSVKTLKAAENFASRFNKKWKERDNTDDNWIDLIVKGEVIRYYTLPDGTEDNT
jgi:hypothetical protein